MSVNAWFIKLLKNRRLTPFPLPEDEFGFPFLVFWCVMFQQRKHEQCNTAWKPVITLRHVFFFNIFNVSLSFKLRWLKRCLAVA